MNASFFSLAPLLVMIAMTSARPAQAAGEWELKRERDGIRVYTREIEGSKYRAVRAVMNMSTTLGQAVALVRDTTVCAEWAALCAESFVAEQVSETELYVYSYNNVPWPAKDRDAVAHVLWSQDPDDLTVTMSADVVPGLVPERDSAVRLTSAVTRWIFRPNPDGTVEIITEAHVDPGGPIPAWLLNLLLVNSPFDTLVNMRRMLASDRFAGVSFGFLKEPRRH